MGDQDRTPVRLVFRIGDAFPADDVMSRYVMRLSMALGDLRIAFNYAVREHQSEPDRMYFVRLIAAHLRELSLVLDPPNRCVMPSVEDFLSSLPPGTEQRQAKIAEAHVRVM